MSVRFHRDDGQVLGLALAFLVFVALILAATLTAAASSLRATQSSAQQRDEHYAADAAIAAAAARIQSNAALGVDAPSPADCDFRPGPDEFVVNSMNVAVTCTPGVGSGQGTVAINRPQYAVLALSGADDEGIIGGTASNLFGRVATAMPSQPCEVAAQTQCDRTGVDPDYAPRAASAPGPAAAPSCAGDTLTFFPGTYTEPPPLLPQVAGCNKPWWFKEGVYYFDFTNVGSHLWTIDNTVVGGMRHDGRWPTGTPPPIPGACRTDQDLGATDGVQFIFGGDSTMRVGPTGAVELCAKPSTSDQQIAVYGMTPTRAPLPQPLPIVSLVTTNPVTTDSTTPSYVPFAQLAGATTPDDGVEAQATIPQTNSASITVTGFSNPPLQPGSVIENAELRVVHHEDPLMQALTLELTDGATTVQPPVPILISGTCGPPDPVQCSQTFDLTPLFRADPTLLSRVSTTVTATAPPGGGPYNSAIDGIVLDLTVDPPSPTNGYRPLVGCTQRTSSVVCPVLSTAPASAASLYVHGTVYAPTGALDVNGRPDDPVRFDRGIIARTVSFEQGSGGAPPGATAGGAFNRDVVLEASVNEKLRLVTSVSFDDVQAFIENKPLPQITYNNWDYK